MIKNPALFFIVLSISEAYAIGKFVKVENCTSTNKSLHIEQCNAINGALNVVVNIFRPLDEVFVSNLVLILIL